MNDELDLYTDDNAGLYLLAGALLGNLERPDCFDSLVDALRMRQVKPEYIVAVRDRLTLALRESGIEPASL